MANDKEIALYYPYIDIRDAGLIKTAALYWDKLQTIVPLDPYELYSEQEYASSVADFYKTDASREAKKEGFLEERIVNPMDESVQRTGRNFILDLRDIPEIKERLAKTLRSQQWRHAGAEKYSTIYMEKFNPNHLLNLAFELKETGVHFSPLTDGSNGIIVPKPFADMYMSRLASTIAQSDNSVPLTNETLWQDAALSRIIDYSEERKQNQSELAMMSLQTIAIDPTMPLIEVLEFRDDNDNRDMLVNFRRQIRELSRQVQIGLDTADKQKVFKEIITDKIVPVKDELEAKLNESNILFGLGCFDIAQAAVTGFITSGGQSWVNGIAGGLVSLGISLTRGLREDRNIIKDHPLGYLYKAQQQLGGVN